MIHSPAFTVVLDACVLYPAPIRDILLSLASEGLFQPKWSTIIQDEWSRNLLQNRTDLNQDQLNLTKYAMNQAFTDANVDSFEELIPGLSLPDENDRHVLACAIKSDANAIVTFNIKDFPKKQLQIHDVDILHPDLFIRNLFDFNEELCCIAFTKMVGRLRNPKKTKVEVIEILEICKLSKSALRFNSCQ